MTQDCCTGQRARYGRTPIAVNRESSSAGGRRAGALHLHSCRPARDGYARSLTRWGTGIARECSGQRCQTRSPCCAATILARTAMQGIQYWPRAGVRAHRRLQPGVGHDVAGYPRRSVRTVCNRTIVWSRVCGRRCWRKTPIPSSSHRIGHPVPRFWSGSRRSRPMALTTCSPKRGGHEHHGASCPSGTLARRIPNAVRHGSGTGWVC
jgi:hypothetical protein